MTLVDLTRPIESEMPTYPGDPAVTVEPAATFESDGYRVSRLELGSHAGTHVDAPAHTEPDGDTLDSYSVEELRMRAQVVDCRGVGAGEEITPEYVPDVDSNIDYSSIDCLVFRTGWEAEWGTDRMTDHPSLSADVGDICAERDWSVAIDALSPDPTGGDVPVHHAVLGAGNVIVENLCGLAQLPTGRPFTLFVMPLRVDADGAPARVVAEV
ncbi:cyclase family protein [Haloferax namakaokahaiae]|uniref:Cyclase family protein n=1 Tax=Haloferax namakaokahaiae TaxID=1748331 RepID=A0ABD5ZA89_9EURY